MAKKKIIKKRGVKPGTKRGPYTKIRDIGAEIGMAPIGHAPANLSLCQQLEETITRFENRIGNSIGRLNELIGKF